MSKETELIIIYLETIKCNPDYINSIKHEFNKPQELYNKIKEKRANARLNYNYHCFEDKEFKGQIAAYNDILSLIESMFGVKNGK